MDYTRKIPIKYIRFVNKKINEIYLKSKIQQ